MKKYCIVLSLAFAGFACGNQTESATKKDSPKETTSVMDNPDYEKGLNLIAKSDCFTCHKLREASVGPSYGDVAKKYSNTPENIGLLADRIIKGSQNVWGSVPMNAHSALTKTDAEKMVKYILLLNE